MSSVIPGARSGQLTIGIGLKLYLDVTQTLSWTERVVEIAGQVAAVRDGRLRCWIVPSFPTLPLVLERTAGTPVAVGAQNLHTCDRGAYTGEVSGADLAELGCRLVEVGHAERRRLFGEGDEVVAGKVLAAVRNGLVPVICIGEPDAGSAAGAAAYCARQLRAALARVDAGAGPVIVAYEPQWAIGAEQAAPADHIRTVCTVLRRTLAELGWSSGRVIYGGSAGPGTLGALADSVDGLFLGRFAHDPDAVSAVLAEAEDVLRRACPSA